MVMVLILFSRILGYVRERAIADVFGLNIETDIFRLAFNIPDLMYFLLIAGGLNAAFIPVFTGYLAKGEEDDGWRLATTFFSIVVGLLIVMVILGVAFAPHLSPLVAYSYRGREQELLRVLDAPHVSRGIFHGHGGRRHGRPPLLPQLCAAAVGPHRL